MTGGPVPAELLSPLRLQKLTCPCSLHIARQQVEHTLREMDTSFKQITSFVVYFSLGPMLKMRVRAVIPAPEDRQGQEDYHKF